MTRETRRPAITAAVLACSFLLVGLPATAQDTPQVQIPQPTVPQIFTIMGKYIRVAYNNHGFVTLGYEVAQRSQGQEWMMLDAGFTVPKPVKDHTLKREHLTVKLPDGTVVPMATQKEYAGAQYLPQLKNMAKVVRDSINYFPVDVSRGCPLGFFTSPEQRSVSYDQVELSPTRACVGRIFFKVPGGIKPGQHWLLVNFGAGEVQVPFRILTAAEEKEFKESWEDIKKAHDESYKQ
jgi:hypothetical protein